MNLMDTAQLLGNFGEFVGAIAVAVTLVFLVVQVRQNTKMLRSNIYASWVEAASKTHTMRAGNAELYGNLYADQSKDFRDLTPAEKTAHEALFTHMVNVWESFFLNYIEGGISAEIFQAKGALNMAQTFSRNPLWLKSWEYHEGGSWDRRFVEYVNNQILQEAGKSVEP